LRKVSDALACEEVDNIQRRGAPKMHEKHAVNTVAQIQGRGRRGQRTGRSVGAAHWRSESHNAYVERQDSTLRTYP